MLALIQLLLITSQKGKIPKVEDIVGEWISTPGWSTNYHTAVFMADGTYEDKDRKGKWYIEGKDVFVGGEKKGEGTRYRYTQNGRALMQYAFDSQAYIRKSTLDIEHNIEGIWSIDANPKAGPPTGKNFIIRLYVDKGHKGYLDLDLDVGRNSVPIKLPSGKTITLFPSKDFN